MQTRLQKLELLRRALFIATKQLFPEIADHNIVIDLRIHRTKDSLLNETVSEGFKEYTSGSTVWLKNPDYHGEICVFK